MYEITTLESLIEKIATGGESPSACFEIGEISPEVLTAVESSSDVRRLPDISGDLYLELTEVWLSGRGLVSCSRCGRMWLSSEVVDGRCPPLWTGRCYGKTYRGLKIDRNELVKILRILGSIIVGASRTGLCLIESDGIERPMDDIELDAAIAEIGAETEEVSDGLRIFISRDSKKVDD